MSGTDIATSSKDTPCELVVMGTGTSVGIPVAGCRCDVCESDDPRNSRTRSGVLVRAPQGEFVIDTGPELRLQLVRHRAALIRAAIFTHAHADHIMGLDDLRIFGFRMESAIPFVLRRMCRRRNSTGFLLRLSGSSHPCTPVCCSQSELCQN